MSRLSRANLKARESIFTSAQSLYRGEILSLCPPDLEECVAAMEDCCEEAYEAQQLLGNGTRDFPRMMKILESDRVFLLVNEETIRRYKSDLTDEVEPAISELIERAEQGLAALEKKEGQLKTKLETMQTRPNRVPAGTTATQKMEARRLQLLVKQRERFEDEVRALEEEVMLLEAKSTKKKF